MATDLLCRSCDTEQPCQPWTIHEYEVTGYKSGVGEYHMGTDTTGQCDDCLQAHGLDMRCGCPPEDQDEAQARAEAEYRDRDRGEL